MTHIGYKPVLNATNRPTPRFAGKKQASAFVPLGMNGRSPDEKQRILSLIQGELRAYDALKAQPVVFEMNQLTPSEQAYAQKEFETVYGRNLIECIRQGQPAYGEGQDMGYVLHNPTERSIFILSRYDRDGE